MYNKLFGKILDSSIWLELTSTRIVWITLLAAMDEDGFAHFSAIENLAARARVTVEEAQNAVEVFMAPDPNSGNPAHDGRRIERVPGGFMVLNAATHRATISRVIQREQTRVRVAKWRDKQRGNTESVTAPLPNATTRPYTEADTDTDTETNNKGTKTTSASSEKISLSAEGTWMNIPESMMKKWSEAFPAVNIEQQLNKAAVWVMANPKNRKSNYARFLSNWLSRVQDRAPRASEERHEADRKPDNSAPGRVRRAHEQRHQSRAKPVN